MSKLNTKGVNKATKARTAVSYNGNPQYPKHSEQQFFEALVLTLYGKDSFYESNDKRIERVVGELSSLVQAGKLDFIANSIIYARTVMNIRTMPIVMLVLFAEQLRNHNKHYNNMRSLVRDTIQRADQITDLLAYALTVFEVKSAIPSAIKKGIADAFNKFNEYAFAKYSGGSGSLKFSDVLRIIHPKAKDIAQATLFDKMMNEARPENLRTSNGVLQTPYTWETQLSDSGKTGKSKKDVWTELIKSNQVGYMALLRNVRNILEADVDTNTLNTVWDRISDPAEVAKSKQLPFRFVSAFEQVNNTKGRTAISRALDASVTNMPKLGDHVWIIIDVSSSMTLGSAMSRPIETACLFAAALAKANAEADNVKITLFSDRAETFAVNTDDSMMGIKQTLCGKVYGGGTNLQAALDHKSKLGFEPDTVIMLSDMQVDRLSKQSVDTLFTKNCVKIAFNLAAYDSTPISEMFGWWQLSGFSERIFDFIPGMRDGKTIAKNLSVPYLGMEVKNLFSRQTENEE